MRLISALLLVFTVAMILVHLTSTHLLRRGWAKETPGWLSVLNLFRFGDWDVMARTRHRTRRYFHLGEISG